MKKLLKLFGFLSISMLLVACPKSEDPATFSPRPYSEVYTENLALIEDFLETHYAVVDGNYNVEIKKIDAGQTPIKAMPNLMTKTVALHDIPGGYKVYYLKLREGLGESPTKLDSAMVSYKGKYLSYVKSTDNSTTPATEITTLTQTQFDYAENPVWFKMNEVVAGWGQIIPEFKTGNAVLSPSGDGTITYSDFGAGVMFLPSGLAYYSSGVGTIPGYAPLVFSFKLMKQRYRDHDGDKIDSRYEFGDFSSSTGIDTDGDGSPDFFDTDDDNDGYLTKNEIKYTYTDNNSVTHTVYYPYTGVLVDDPATPFIDETKGIPACGNTDFTSSTRIRKHLDKNCH